MIHSILCMFPFVSGGMPYFKITSQFTRGPRTVVVENLCTDGAGLGLLYTKSAEVMSLVKQFT